MEKVSYTEFKGRISWGSIIAGVVTVLAISILLSILGSSIGLFMFDPQSEHPVSGIGTTVGIWTAFALIISLAAGGFVAGKLATRDGMIHGFLVWATTIIVAIIWIACMAMGAMRMTGNILGSVSSMTGHVIAGVGSAVGNGVSDLTHEAGDILNDIGFTGEINKKEVRRDIRQALRKSGVKEFQPEYLENQMRAVRSDLNSSVRKLVTNPKEADMIINAFLDRVKTRMESAFGDVNRDDLTKAIANNSNLSKAEVDKAVDEYMDLIQTGIDEGKVQIENLQQSIEQMKQDWEQMKQEALEKAEKAANMAARSALISFFALLIGAVVCAFAGSFGIRKTREGYEV